MASVLSNKVDAIKSYPIEKIIIIKLIPKPSVCDEMKYFSRSCIPIGIGRKMFKNDWFIWWIGFL